ncbi:MAG: mismatch-specific DNA-glycosylase [Firmicutes bacterium]|nr:mismatch-specific DNA-glycosylase [Bacillota bacterium]
MALVVDSLDTGLRILFIGFNPSPASETSGHPYAHRSNRFYRILYESGLTPVLHAPAEHRDMRSLYGYGFTNIVARTTRRADELSTEEYAAGRQLVIEKLERYQPFIACFVGKGVYRPYARKSQFPYGFQTIPVVNSIREFVGPATSGLVRMPLTEQVAIYRQLADALEAD